MAFARAINIIFALFIPEAINITGKKGNISPTLIKDGSKRPFVSPSGLQKSSQ